MSFLRFSFLFGTFYLTRFFKSVSVYLKSLGVRVILRVSKTVLLHICYIRFILCIIVLTLIYFISKTRLPLVALLFISMETPT